MATQILTTIIAADHLLSRFRVYNLIALDCMSVIRREVTFQ